MESPIVARVSHNPPSEFELSHLRLHSTVWDVRVTGDEVSHEYVSFSLDGPDGNAQFAVAAVALRFGGDWQFDCLTPCSEAQIAENEHREFEAFERQRMQRPYSGSFESDTPEFYRWFEYGGKARPCPLEPDELAAYLVSKRGYDEAQAKDSVTRFSHAREGDRALWKSMNPVSPEDAHAYADQAGAPRVPVVKSRAMGF